MHATNKPAAADRSYTLPPLGDNPSTDREGTTPGSFAQRGRVGTPWTFASPDTPGMPQPSDKTAWDFLPEGWWTDLYESGEKECSTSLEDAIAKLRAWGVAE